MTNIIKDCSEDYRRGWCYIPADLAAKFGVPIAEFFVPEHHQQSLAALDHLVVKTAKHLDDALDYTLQLPRTEIRMRLFNLWSLFFAVKTLSKAWHNKDLLCGETKVKISRCEVYKTLAQTVFLVTSNALLRRLYHRFRDKSPAENNAVLLWPIGYSWSPAPGSCCRSCTELVDHDMRNRNGSGRR
jgi:farnesyl-diphosphate farnesyltransferase